jgi:hypothetical protein
MRPTAIIDGLLRLSELGNVFERRIADAARTLAVVLAATLIGAVGIGFVIAAVQIELAARIGAGLAALAIGAGLLLLALLVLLVGARRRPAPRPPARPAARPEARGEQAVADAALDLVERVGRETQRSPGPMLLAALVVGVALGLSRGGGRDGR